MNAPFRWTFPGIAGIATLVALLVGANPDIAIAAATVAVASGGLALWDSVRSRTPASGTPRTGYSLPVDMSELWFHTGATSQEAIVLLLDRIDRAVAHPEMPARDRDETARLSRLPRDQFLSYVESRLSELEAAS